MRSTLRAVAAAAVLLAAFGAALFAAPARADAVFVVTNTAPAYPGDYRLVDAPAVKTADLVIVCTSTAVSAGRADMAKCGSARVRIPRSSVLPAQLVGYCYGGTPGAAVLSCDIANGGGEGWQRADAIWPAAPVPPVVDPPTAETGSVLLTWTLPTAKTDGSPLTNLAAINVYGAQTTTGLALLARVPAPATSASIDNLAAGTWYFAGTAVDAAGVESLPTGLVSATIAGTPAPTCTALKPADETQTVQCTAPAVGSWTQSRTYLAAPYPGCWSPSAWTPTTAPAGACTTPVTWKVATNGTTPTRPAYELIRNATDTAWARGYQLGTVPVGAACGEAKEISGTTEYHRIADASGVVLQSPTYRGRTLVAVCSRQ